MARGKSYAKLGNRFVTGERMKVLNENVTYNTTPLLPSSFLVHLSISPGKRVNSYFPRRVDLRSSILSDITFSIHARFTMYLFVYKKREKKRKEETRNSSSIILLLESADTLCSDIYTREDVVTYARYIPYPHSTKQRTRARVRARQREIEIERREKKGITAE